MARRLLVEIVGDSSKLDREFSKATRETRGFQRTLEQAGRGAVTASLGFSGLGRTVAYASAAFIGTAGIVTAVRAGVSEFAQASRVAAQTNAVLKSTGASAGVTAGSVDALAQALMQKSGVDDEAIKSGENLLLTFTNIRNSVGKGNDVFDQATKAALDMSVALGQDISQSSIQLGKALNDPIKGVTALRRVGVSFTAAQVDMIKALVGSGRGLEAQKLILAEVNKEFGGSAETVGKTLPGQIALLQQSFSNLAGTLVGSVAPAFASGINAINGLLTKVNDAQGTTAKLQVIWAAVSEGARNVGASIVAAIRGVDWDAVGQSLLDGVRSAAGYLAAQVQSVDWAGARDALASGLVAYLNTISRWIRMVDWETVGSEMVRGIGLAVGKMIKFLAGVDWKSVFGAMVNLWVTELRSLGSLLLGVGSELGSAIKDGFVVALRYFGQTVADLVLRPVNAVIRAINSIKIPSFSTSVLGHKIGSPAIDPIPHLGELSVNLRGGGSSGPTGNVSDVSARSIAGQARAIAAAQAQVDSLIGAVTPAATRNLPAFNFGGELSAADKAKAAKAAAAARKKASAARTKALEAAAAAAAGSLEAAFQNRKPLGVEKTLTIADVNRAMAARSQASQFRALGLTATGDALAPTRGALTRETNRIGNALKGTLLDTDKNRNLLGRVRKVLSGQWASLTRDTRLAIKGMLDALTGELGDKGKLNKIRAVSTKRLADQLTAGLNVDAATKRMLQFNIAGAHLTTRPGGNRLDVHTNVNLDGRQVGRSVRRDAARTAHRTARQTSGWLDG